MEFSQRCSIAPLEQERSTDAAANRRVSASPWVGSYSRPAMRYSKVRQERSPLIQVPLRPRVSGRIPSHSSAPAARCAAVAVSRWWREVPVPEVAASRSKRSASGRGRAEPAASAEPVEEVETVEFSSGRSTLRHSAGGLCCTAWVPRSLSR